MASGCCTLMATPDHAQRKPGSAHCTLKGIGQTPLAIRVAASKELGRLAGTVHKRTLVTDECQKLSCRALAVIWPNLSAASAGAKRATVAHCTAGLPTSYMAMLYPPWPFPCRCKAAMIACMCACVSVCSC
eukprot:1143360-Pelagomonas_calceolata.AAC.1